jgi:hypothetical protein
MKVYIIKDSANFTHITFNKNLYNYPREIKEVDVRNYWELEKLFENSEEPFEQYTLVRIINELIGGNK